MLIIAPAKGADFTTQEAVVEAWFSGESFEVQNYFDVFWLGQIVTKDLIKNAQVKIIFDRGSKCVVV